MEQSIRWKQRFQNFEKAFSLLKEAAAITHPSDTERAGLIQFFELTLELAWKTLKDYLEAQGFQISSPREAIKQAFQSGLIADGHPWMEALDDRNLTTHTYDESVSLKVEKLIKGKYYPLLKTLHEELNQREKI